MGVINQLITGGHHPVGISMIQLDLGKLITSSLRANPGNHGECIGKSSPFMAARFRLVKYYNLPRLDSTEEKLEDLGEWSVRIRKPNGWAKLVNHYSHARRNICWLSHKKSLFGTGVPNSVSSPLANRGRSHMCSTAQPTTSFLIFWLVVWNIFHSSIYWEYSWELPIYANPPKYIYIYIHCIYSGWWCGTNFIFPYIGNVNHPNWRTHIFQRGRYTTVLQAEIDGIDQKLWERCSSAMQRLKMGVSENRLNP